MEKKKFLNFVDGGVDVELFTGISISGVKTKTVRMREPTVADQESAAAIQGNDATREIVTFANLCQVTPDEIRALTMRDYKRLQEGYLAFID